MLHNVPEFRHCGWIIQISLLRNPREGKDDDLPQVMSDFLSQTLTASEQRTRLREERAGFRMGPGANGLPHRAKEVQDTAPAVLELLKNITVSYQLGLVMSASAFEFVDAYQCISSAV